MRRSDWMAMIAPTRIIAKVAARLRRNAEIAAVVAGTAGNNTCMSEQGYVLRTRSAHKAACEAMPAKKENNAANKRRSLFILIAQDVIQSVE